MVSSFEGSQLSKIYIPRVLLVGGRGVDSFPTWRDVLVRFGLH